ncbi:hypothetical protein PSSHI_07750 [Photobacterium sp. R1]
MISLFLRPKDEISRTMLFNLQFIVTNKTDNRSFLYLIFGVKRMLYILSF